MSRLLRIGLTACLWLALLGGIAFWFSSREVTQLTIAAGGASAESFELAQAIADVVEADNPRVRVDVYETQGSQENIELVNSGKVDFAAVQADAEVTPDERSIAKLFADAFQLVVTKESDVDSVHDLIGKRVAIPPAGSGQNSSFWFLLEHFRIAPESLTALAMSDDAANFAMQQGQIDAVFRVRAPGNRLVRELVRDQENIRLVPIGQAAALALRNPTIRAGTIPRGSYRGYPALPLDNTETAMVDRVLIARKDLDSDIVYGLTRILFEQRAALVSRSNLAGFISPIDDADRIPIALHDGARRYFEREKPSLVQENSRLLATLLYIGALFTSLIIGLRARVRKAHQVRVSDYNSELMEIAEQAQNSDADNDVGPLRKRLDEILRHVVSELRAERVTDDEFNHFSFCWQAADRAVRDQLARYAPVTGATSN